MIPVLEFNQHGDIETLYTEEVDLKELGLLSGVHRASYIRFNEESQSWDVIDAQTQEKVYTDVSRKSAIEWEIVHFGPDGELWGHRGVEHGKNT